MVETQTWISLLWPVLLAAVGFLIGKVFGQSEKILDQKRKVYSDFLRVCPAPNEAHLCEEPDYISLQREIGILTIYASVEATRYAGKYFEDFAEAQSIIAGVEEAGHPRFLELLTHYNRMVWAMRVDAMTWSLFAPRKSAREYKPSKYVRPKQ